MTSEKSCAACGLLESEHLDAKGEAKPLRQNRKNPREWLCDQCPDDPEDP